MPTFFSSQADFAQRSRLRRWACALLVPLCALAMLGTAQARDDDVDEETYAIGLWGDLPYSPA